MPLNVYFEYGIILFEIHLFAKGSVIMAVFSVNDTVIYGIHGICKITAVEKKDFFGQEQEYYVLVPLYEEKTSVFVPVNNEELTARIKKIMSADEIYDIISGMPSEKDIWIENETERKKFYSDILKSGDRRAMIGMIKTLYLHKIKQLSDKKHLHAADDRFMKEAEKILYQEFAYVLNISREEVIPFIAQQIEVGVKKA